MPPFLHIFVAAVTGAVFLTQLVRTPEADRAQAYPNQRDRWHHQDPRSVLGVLGTTFFWSLALALGGILAGAAAIFGYAPAFGGYFIGFWASFAISWRIAKPGIGMLRPIPRASKTPVGTRPRVLFIGGSPNQCGQVHQVAEAMGDIDAFFTPYFNDHPGFVIIHKLGLDDVAISSYRRRASAFAYYQRHNLPVDLYGERNTYDMVVTTNDQVVPGSLRYAPVLLIQEGMQDPPDWRLHLWKWGLLHATLTGTSTNGLSDKYDRFCVASEGYREHFARFGADPAKMVVTGMPNFDNFARFKQNNLNRHGYLLVCTSDSRETAVKSDRMGFLRRVAERAGDMPVLVKLHPNEKRERACREVASVLPQAEVVQEGSAEEMVANCEVLFTEWSSVTFAGVALGKEVHSNYTPEQLQHLLPIQTGRAAQEIARECWAILRAARINPAAPPRAHGTQPRNPQYASRRTITQEIA